METTPLYDCIAEMLMSGPQSATYYRAAAARAKALQAITTTLRLKQFLAEMAAGLSASWHEKAEELRTAADDMIRRYQHVDLSKTSREAIRELFKLPMRCAGLAHCLPRFEYPRPGTEASRDFPEGHSAMRGLPSNKEWEIWGEIDPLFGVATWKGKEKKWCQSLDDRRVLRSWTGRLVILQITLGKIRIEQW